MNKVCAVILAAGKGTRMKSTLPKVLHPILGKPMIAYVLDALEAMGVEDRLLLVGHGSEQVTAAVAGRARTVVQEPQLGTGHAIQVAAPHIPEDADTVLVVSGDQPLITETMLSSLVRDHQEGGHAMSMLLASLPWPNDLGRVVRRSDGSVERIVESREASPAELALHEVNLGTYCFERQHLLQGLPQLGRSNAQKEIYLTDMVLITQEVGKRVHAVDAGDPHSSIGVNSRKEIAQVTAVLRERLADHWMSEGVTILDPSSVIIEPGVQIGRDTILYPHTILEGRTVIGEGCTLGPSTRLSNCHLGDGVTVQYSVLLEAQADAGCTVGPFAYLRPGTSLGPSVKVGDFVEIKNARIEAGSKVPHLSYIGDAQIGRKVNIGAGTITCNYDGKNKHRTVIEDGVHIGSNTNLVAPVRVGAGAVTGAGAVVTRDVLAGDTVVGVPARALRSGLASH